MAPGAIPKVASINTATPLRRYDILFYPFNLILLLSL